MLGMPSKYEQHQSIVPSKIEHRCENTHLEVIIKMGFPTKILTIIDDMQEQKDFFWVTTSRGVITTKATKEAALVDFWDYNIL